MALLESVEFLEICTGTFLVDAKTRSFLSFLLTFVLLLGGVGVVVVVVVSKVVLLSRTAGVVKF